MVEEIGHPWTFGQKAVGLLADTEENEVANSCKLAFADIIDGLHLLRLKAGHSEQGRLASIAITEAETACMWAVKAVSWRG